MLVVLVVVALVIPAHLMWLPAWLPRLPAWLPTLILSRTLLLRPTRLLKKWRDEPRPGSLVVVDPMTHARRKQLSEVLESQVRMGHITEAEMKEIMTKDDRAAADKVGTGC